MILTPISATDLPGLIERFDRALEGCHPAQAIFRRIADSRHATGKTIEERHADGVALCHAFGMPTIFEEPQQAFSWDGHSVRVLSEPAVLIHEVAHYQVCAPSRRFTYDFGLGAGPESGRAEEADAAMALHGVERDVEEGLSSLLGIIWEAELGHPAIEAYLEQNWFEGADRRENREHFCKMTAMLLENGMIDEDGHPLMTLRITEDAEFFGWDKAEQAA